MLPVQRPRDLHGLAVRIVPGGAVQPERPAGERDVHPDPVLADPGGRRGRHPGVGGPLGADPDLEDAVVAHPAHGVVRLHRGVREVGQLVERVHHMRRAGERGLDVAVFPGHHGLLAGLDEPPVLGQQLLRAAPLGVAVVPVHPQRAQAPLRVVERLADHRDALLDRDHRGDAGLGQRRAVIDRGGHGAELGRVQHHRGQHPGQGDVDGEPGLPEDLPRGVDPEPALGPDELVPARVLGTDVVRDRQLRGARGEVAEARPLPARVAHRARLELHFVRPARPRPQPRPRPAAPAPGRQPGGNGPRNPWSRWTRRSAG